MSDQSDLHNQIVGGIVADIVKPVTAAGGGVADVLVVLESVVLGVMLYAEHDHGAPADALVDVQARRVKSRLDELRAARQRQLN